MAFSIAFKTWAQFNSRLKVSAFFTDFGKYWRAVLMRSAALRNADNISGAAAIKAALARLRLGFCPFPDTANDATAGKSDGGRIYNVLAPPALLSTTRHGPGVWLVVFPLFWFPLSAFVFFVFMLFFFRVLFLPAVGDGGGR